MAARGSGPPRSNIFLPPSGSAYSSMQGQTSVAQNVANVIARVDAFKGKGAGKGHCKGCGKMGKSSESMTLLQEMKFKQDQREKRKRLKEELEMMSHAGGVDLGRMNRLRLELSAVEAYLAKTDGIHTLQEQLPVAQPMTREEDTANLYIGSLAPDWTEEMILREFGKFGEITSIKIMYPRTDAQRLRGMNSGFVQFKKRRQAENARNAMNNREYFGMCLRIDWGRAIETRASHGFMPVAAPHVPSVEPHMGPDVTPPLGEKRRSGWNKAKTIMVQAPGEAAVKRLIDKTAEFVAADGWEFEKLLLDQEADNPRFGWLRSSKDAEDALHVYYRWRVVAFSQGDSESMWRSEPFQIYENGPLWQAPPCESTRTDADSISPIIPTLSISLTGCGSPLAAPTSGIRGTSGAGGGELVAEELGNLNTLISELTLNRCTILKATAFCLDLASSSQAIVQRLAGTITEAQEGLTTAQVTARLYVLSDVLYNSHCSRPGASMYRRQFQEYLPDIFERLREICSGIAPIAAGALRERVMKLLHIWAEWSLFPPLFTKGLAATLCHEARHEDHSNSPAALRVKLCQWSSTQDFFSLERACRMRGLVARDSRDDLVQRLSVFEAYWFEKAPEEEAREEEERLRKIEESLLNPDFDGEGVEAKELEELLAEEGKEAERLQAEILSSVFLSGVGVKDARQSANVERGSPADQLIRVPGKTTTAPKVPNRWKVEAPVSATAQPLSSGVPVLGSSPVSTQGQDDSARAQADATAPTADSNAAPAVLCKTLTEQEQRKAQMREIEVAVQRYQQSLEASRERPEQIAMMCDKKRMELLEASAARQAAEDLKAKDEKEQAAAAAAATAAATAAAEVAKAGAPHAPVATPITNAKPLAAQLQAAQLVQNESDSVSDSESAMYSSDESEQKKATLRQQEKAKRREKEKQATIERLHKEKRRQKKAKDKEKQRDVDTSKAKAKDKSKDKSKDADKDRKKSESKVKRASSPDKPKRDKRKEKDRTRSRERKSKRTKH